jgi:hypothetical protein
MEAVMKGEAKKAPRRSRADSKESAVKDMMAADRLIKPPAEVKLSKDEVVIFNEIIDELPRGEWTAHMVRMAAALARDIHSAEREQEALFREGTVVHAANGSPIRNPRCAQLNGLTATIIASRRSLSLHSRSKAGMDNRVLARRRDIQRENEANAPDDDLISKPKFH